MNLANFDPDKICNLEGPKTVFREFLNILEELQGENARLRKDTQEMRDEIMRLKGENGKPLLSR